MAALAFSGLALAGCGTTGSAVLNNVSQDCDRHYDGTISAGITGGQFTGTFKADCKAASSRAAGLRGALEAPQTGEPQPTSVTPTS